MLKKFITWGSMNRKSIMITFEVFWLLVFLLDRITSANSTGIPQFIYVNF